MKDLVSIIILNYNGLNYLRRTIYPLLELNYSNYEIIVVDNGSNDESIKFLKKIERIKIIRNKENLGLNKGYNIGSTFARGKFILFLDNDSLIEDKDILRELLSRYTEKTGTIALAFKEEGLSNFKNYGPYFMNYNFTKELKIKSEEELKKYDNIEIVHPDGKGFFIEKIKWEEIEGYDEHLFFGGSDSEIGIKLILLGYKNYFYSKTIQKHIGLLERTNNRKYSWKFKLLFYSHLYVILKNFNKRNLFISIIVFSFISFLKAIKQSLKRLHLGPFFAYFSGWFLFFTNLSVNIEKRKEAQSRRIIKEDIFLTIGRYKNYLY